MNSTAAIEPPRRIRDSWRTPDGRGLNGEFDAVAFWPHRPESCTPNCMGKTFFFSVRGFGGFHDNGQEGWVPGAGVNSEEIQGVVQLAPV